MKIIRTDALRDRLMMSGIILIMISAGTFSLTDLVKLRNDQKTVLFVVHYGLTVVYSLTVLFGSFSWSRRRFDAWRTEYAVLLLILWLISAFSLNRAMNVFDDSAPWLCVLIVLSCCVLILYIFTEPAPLPYSHVLSFLMPAPLLLFAYYTIYLSPLYLISIPATLFLGISLHSFVPLFLTIVTGVMTVRNIRRQRVLIWSFFTGVSVVLCYCAWFIAVWNSQNQRIAQLLNTNTLDNEQVPGWVSVAMHMSKGPVAEKLMKADLVYKTAGDTGNWLFGGLPSTIFDEKKKHHPLVVIASFFCRDVPLDLKDRVSILAAMHGSRHQAQERLWNGSDLETTSVVSNILICPEYRLAYTEKTLSIRNNSRNEWRSEQEAIYTFYLPEGSTVSSLSLWIDGQEEKARLTTRSNADSAYRTIVGREMRDPSVVHWQEGNTVSVRVFPCGTSEHRKFKIGITSPLKKAGDRLTYQNIRFDGPAAGAAAEQIQLSFTQPARQLSLPGLFRSAGHDRSTYSGAYLPSWELACEAPALSSDAFTFNGLTYRVGNYTPVYTAFDAKQVFLDLNRSWTEQELIDVWNIVKSKNVYVHYGRLIRLTDQNIISVYRQMSVLNFSLFPVYEIGDRAGSLIISKSAAASADLSDLTGSGFQKRLTSYFQRDETSVRLFDLGDELSPYLLTLKEFRVLTVARGNLSDLKNNIARKRFVSDIEDPATTLIGPAELLIKQTTAPADAAAPDLLLRLFAYNDIMKRTAPLYFDHSFLTPELVRRAREANIVSPVSSLVVLETKADYERFGIKESRNSLENAAMKSIGAAPEPAEWLLIIVAAATAAILLYRQRAYRYAP